MKNGHRTSIPQGTMSNPLRYMHTLILKEEDVKNEKKYLISLKRSVKSACGDGYT
jgi:putative aminopeptidase FrvX